MLWPSALRWLCLNTRLPVRTRSLFWWFRFPGWTTVLEKKPPPTPPPTYYPNTSNTSLGTLTLWRYNHGEIIVLKDEKKKINFLSKTINCLCILEIIHTSISTMYVLHTIKTMFSVHIYIEVCTAAVTYKLYYLDISYVLIRLSFFTQNRISNSTMHYLQMFKNIYSTLSINRSHYLSFISCLCNTRVETIIVLI